VPILSLVSRPADQYRKERVMTRSMFSNDPILLVNAYLDGELDSRQCARHRAANGRRFCTCR
jgi:hypothetical protein